MSDDQPFEDDDQPVEDLDTREEDRDQQVDSEAIFISHQEGYELQSFQAGPLPFPAGSWPLLLRLASIIRSYQDSPIESQPWWKRKPNIDAKRKLES